MRIATLAPFAGYIRTGRENLTDRRKQRLVDAFAVREEHVEVDVARQCAQQLRDANREADLTTGCKIAEQVLDSCPSCPIPEIARLGRPLTRWRDAFLSHGGTGRSSNDGTEAVAGRIGPARHITRGFRDGDDDRRRMLLIAGRLDSTGPPKVRRATFLGRSVSRS